MASPTRTPTRTVQPRAFGHLGHELVIERQRGQLVGAPGEDERPWSEVEPMLLLDEIAAREQPVGELLNGALGRVEGGCQLRKGDAARVQRHGVEDLDHSVDGAMRTRGHVADASKPLRQVRMALDNRGVAPVHSPPCPYIRFYIQNYVR